MADPAGATNPMEWARQAAGSASAERKVVDGFPPTPRLLVVQAEGDLLPGVRVALVVV